MSGLAFGHAAELYACCLALHDGPAEQRRELLRKLAEALANGGHGRQAADAYLEASTLASGPAAVELMRLATGQEPSARCEPLLSRAVPDLAV